MDGVCEGSSGLVCIVVVMVGGENGLVVVRVVVDVERGEGRGGVY